MSSQSAPKTPQGVSNKPGELPIILQTNSKEPGDDNNMYNTTLNDNLQPNSEEDANRTFLIKKFLQNSNGEIQTENNLIKQGIRPIPKPRRKNNLIEKVVNHSNNNSMSSQKTYVVGNNTTAKNMETVNVIIHNNHSISSSSTSTSPKGDSPNNIDKYLSDKLENADEINNTLGSPKKYINEESNVQNKVFVDGKPSKINVTDTDRDTDVTCNYKYDKIVEIIIHKADALQLESYVAHPTVKVHIVDINNGNYYLKSNKGRSVVFYYENEEQKYILPVMTGSYNLQEKRTFNPEWEETILLNEDFEYLINENIIIFFEVLDYIPYVSKKANKIQKYCYKGWRTITFAFLKLVGRNQLFNINKKVKLQLYYPDTIKKRDPTKCDLWYLWKSGKLKNYPSALYVTVRSVISPKNVIETFRSKTPLQKERISDIRNYRQCSKKTTIEKEVLSKVKVGSHSSSESFELPNKLLAELDSYDNGCFLLRFSNNGLYLACAVQINGMFVVTVYTVKSFEEVSSINEHRGLIYSINWSVDDSLLLTASADNTVVIWNYSTNSFLQILPHPIYVYTSQISYDNTQIVTGCYDSTVRIWLYNKQEEKYELHQEMEKHEGYVTSTCFNNKSTNLYSSDSTGHIFEWSKLDNFDWQFERSISTPDLTDTIINEILLFPNGKKMLVHSRDSILRIISIKRACVLFWLQGALNFRLQTFCSISPCGSYITSGSENGLVIVWDAKTGTDVMTYEPFINHLYLETVHCTQFHPKDNIIAFSHYGSVCPILLYHYNVTKEKQKNISQNICHEKDNSSIVSEAPASKEKLSFYNILEKMDKLLN